jgi:hypothetical protein
MFCNGREIGKLIGFALLFIGLGMLLSTLLTWGWFMVIIAIVLIVIGTYLACLY